MAPDEATHAAADRRPKKGLLADFGGVLTSSVWESFSSFCRTEGLEEDAVRRLFRDDARALGLLRELETGKLTEDSFAERFGPMLGVADHERLVHRLFAGMQPDHAMIDAIRRARDAGIRTGLISNSWGDAGYEGVVLGELFDEVVISGKVGLHKPQAEIFELAAERVRLRPEECVFVDDLRENCAGAEAVGMTAVLHRSAAETVPRLEELLGLSLRAPA
jgi:epoxide hydrolase-like predicted phosphatase